MEFKYKPAATGKQYQGYLNLKRYLYHSRRAEQRAVELLKVARSIGRTDNLQQGALKFNWITSGNKCFLEKIALGLALAVAVVVLGVLKLLHEVAFTVAMHPGFVAVFAKLGSDIVFVQFETRENKKAREMRREHRNY